MDKKALFFQLRDTIEALEAAAEVLRHDLLYGEIGDAYTKQSPQITWKVPRNLMEDIFLGKRSLIDLVGPVQVLLINPRGKVIPWAEVKHSKLDLFQDNTRVGLDTADQSFTWRPNKNYQLINIARIEIRRQLGEVVTYAELDEPITVDWPDTFTVETSVKGLISSTEFE